MSNNICPMNSPINISEIDRKSKCTDKCNYQVGYKNSAVSISNHATYLSIPYKNTESQVKFNNAKYNVDEVRLYSPSLNTYNGIHVGCEMIIIHTPVSGGNQLFVCIPVKTSNPPNPASITLTSIIEGASVLVNDKTISTPATMDKIKNFNLNLFIPRKPFYYYEGDYFLECLPTIPKVDVICYLPFASNIFITAETMQKLNQILDPSGISPPKKTEENADTYPDLNFNEHGVTSVDSDDSGDVVMDCQPYETSEETVDVVVENDEGTYDPSKLVDNPWFQVISGSIVFFLMIIFLKFVFGLVNKKSGSSSSSGSFMSGGGIFGSGVKTNK
jgi:carbonic anhydrase